MRAYAWVMHPEGVLAVLTPGYFRPTLPHRTVRRYGACPMGTAGTPPACAQCETGYVPPRLLGALPNRDSLLLEGTLRYPGYSRVLEGYPRDC